jgi:predicted Zn-dependent protease
MQAKIFVLLCVCGLAAAQYSEKEKALGAQVAREVRREYKALESPAALEYVRRLAGALGGSALQADVVGSSDSGLQEPFALPGGYVLVRASLFLAVHDEAEFAGMLAHAISHIIERHGLPQTTNMAGIPLVFMGGWTGDERMMPAAFARTHQKREMEADKSALRLLAAAGYDPAALLRYVERFRTPAREDRIAALAEAVQALEPRSYSVSGGFDAARDEVRRLLNQPPAEKKEPPTLRRKAPQQP